MTAITVAQQNKIRKFRGSYKGRHRPETDRNSKEEVIHAITSSLYTPHLSFYHRRLLKLIEANMFLHVMKGEPRTFGINYAGRSWFVPWMEAQSETDFMNLPAADGLDEPELLKVTTGLATIDVEMYEVKRFLAGLLSFNAPMEIMEERLGRSLFGRVKKHLQSVQREAWNEANLAAFNKYADAHDYLIDTMCNRIMMNLLSKQAFNKR